MISIFEISWLVLGLLAVQVSEANAVVCARGVYRAGCVGPYSAVGVHRPYGYGAYGARRYGRMAFTAAIMAVRVSTADGGTPKGCFG
jgi:hypothetical protein